MIVMKKGHIYMGKDNNVIVAQVVYKGLIDLVIADKIKIDEVNSDNMQKHYDLIIKYNDNTAQQSGGKFPHKSVGQGMQGNASEKQINWIEKLVKGVEEQGYQALASDCREEIASGLGKQRASEWIDILQEPAKHLQKVANSTKVTPKSVDETENVAPF